MKFGPAHGPKPPLKTPTRPQLEIDIEVGEW